MKRTDDDTVVVSQEASKRTHHLCVPHRLLAPLVLKFHAVPVQVAAQFAEEHLQHRCMLP